MSDNEGSESGGFSVLEDMFNSLCGEQEYGDAVSDNVVVSFCGGTCGGTSNSNSDNLQNRHTNMAGLDRNFFRSDFLGDDGEDPTALELTRILSVDAHLIVLSGVVIQSLKTLGKVGGISTRPNGDVGYGEDGPSLVSYASRCVKRTQARDIYSVSYCPTEAEKEETSDLPSGTTQFLKPWSILLKRGVVDVHFGGKSVVVGGSLSKSNKSEVGFFPGKSCRQSHSTTTSNVEPAYIKDSTSNNAEVVLLNHALVVFPSASPSVDEMKGEQNSDMAANAIPPMSYPLTSILAVMDLGVCSCKSRNVKNISTPTTTTQSRETMKQKSMFQKMKKVKMSKLVSIEESPPISSKNYKDPYDDESGSTSEDNSLDETPDESAFCIVAANPSPGEDAAVLTMHCSTPTHKILWLHALHRTLSGMPHFRKPCTFTNTRLNDDIGKQHSIMRTSIYSACLLNDTKMLNRILQGGQNDGIAYSQNASRQVIDVADSNGYSALHYAVMCRFNKCVRILLDAGANPNIKDSSGRTPVDYAVETQQSKALGMLQSKGGETNMELASEKKDNIDNKKSIMGEEMQKRHEKLERMGEKSAGIHAKSAMYRDMAKQLKNKVKN